MVSFLLKSDMDARMKLLPRFRTDPSCPPRSVPDVSNDEIWCTACSSDGSLHDMDEPLHAQVLQRLAQFALQVTHVLEAD